MQILLTFHILSAVCVAILSYVVLMLLLKREVAVVKCVRAVYSTCLLSLIAFGTGLYYYSTHYLGEAQGIILKGQYAWADTVLVKLVGLLFLIVIGSIVYEAYSLHKNGASLNTEPAYKKQIMLLTIIATVCAVLISLAEILILGAGKY